MTLVRDKGIHRYMGSMNPQAENSAVVLRKNSKKLSDLILGIVKDKLRKHRSKVSEKNFQCNQHRKRSTANVRLKKFDLALLCKTSKC
ncbi:hypothetical protein CDAR_220031 [Caerostris darwini]|uniref:Uncharacterized protein n=1 Tax=Caerostris darwini TaxID=1538125 RepID=A0AAV4VHC9_9ARAC|nr:hypothetical protein CDAR_220031 [Caerostris darwini]